MNLLFWNVFLAAAWALASGELSLTNLAIGFVLGYAALGLAQPALGRSDYFRRVRRAAEFCVWFLWELILANLQVAYDVITPTYHMRPGIVAIPLDAQTDLEITLLANLITLTPGTVSLDVSDDRRVLYVHGMFVDDVESFRDNLKSGLERRLLELLR